MAMQFDPPQDPGTTSPPTPDPSEFDTPDAGQSASSAESAEIQAFTSQASSTLLEVKAAIEEGLAARADRGVIQAAAFTSGADAIVGVGLGVGDAGSGAPGEPCLELYVAEPMPAEAVRASLASALHVSAAAADDVPMSVQVTGIIDAYPHRMRMRPAPGGISVGHFNITAGTLGCLSVGRSAPRTSRLMVLSNNHVLANSNNARLNDCIAQPGPADGGRCPADQIAILERFVPIRFGGPVNLVDCATGWAWPDRVRRELMYIQGGVTRFFRVGSAPVAAQPNLVVGKSGRTTQLTQGRITAVGVTINVNYGAAGVARFSDQIAIVGTGGLFSQGGDSGSLIWTWDTRRAPVGLLFAGGGNMTFANRIGRALDALDINLFT